MVKNLKTIAKYLINFLREDFNWKYYSISAALIAAGIYANYVLGLKESWIDKNYGDFEHIARYGLFFGGTYYIFAFLRFIFYNEKKYFKSGGFWTASAFAMFILVLNALTKTQINDFLRALEVPYNLYNWLFYVTANFQRLIVLGAIVVAYKYAFDRGEKRLYGLTLKNFDPKPYLYMLLIMAPLIAWASFRPDFLHTYPIYKPGLAETSAGLPQYMTVGVFEFFYGMRFISVEFFFRGFLIVGMARFIGSAAIMPMVATYAFWHFGKPMPETLGSIFGGYILGVIALRSKTIFGGILIHMGVALLMEFAAHMQYIFNKSIIP